MDDAIVLLLGSDPGRSERRGEIRGVTRLEKLVFLLEQETDAANAMTETAEYRAHHYGPFSQKVYQALEVLRAAGLIQDSAQASATNEDQSEYARVAGNDAAPAPYSTRDFRLTEDGRNYYRALVAELPLGVVESAEHLRKQFAGWPLRRLIRYVYERYDEFTTNSRIRGDILNEG
ncbi:hypothetical protein [Microbacterium maritypicum]